MIEGVNYEAIDFKAIKEAAIAINGSSAIVDAGLSKMKVIGKKEDLIDSFIHLVEEISEKELGEDLPEICIVMYNSIFPTDEEEDGEVEAAIQDADEDAAEDGCSEPGVPSDEDEAPADEDEPSADEKEEEELLDTLSSKKPKPVAPSEPKGKVKKEKKEKAPKVVKEKVAKEPKAPKAPKEPKERKEIVKSCYGHYAFAKSGMMDEMLRKGTSIVEIEERLGVPKGRVNSHLLALKAKGLTVIITPKDSAGNPETLRVKENSLAE